MKKYFFALILLLFASSASAGNVTLGTGPAVKLGTGPAVLLENTPKSLGAIFWLRSDLGVTLTSGKVSSWADQSGDGNDASQSTADYRPVVTSAHYKGIDAITFDGTNDFLLANSIATKYLEGTDKPITLILVANLKDDVNVGYVPFYTAEDDVNRNARDFGLIKDWTLELECAIWDNTPTYKKLDAGNFYPGNGEACWAYFYIYDGKKASIYKMYSGGVYSIFIDGDLDVDYFHALYFNISGAYENGVCFDYWWNGDMFEIIAWNESLIVTGKLQSMFDYVRNRYTIY